MTVTKTKCWSSYVLSCPAPHCKDESGNRTSDGAVTRQGSEGEAGNRTRDRQVTNQRCAGAAGNPFHSRARGPEAKSGIKSGIARVPAKDPKVRSGIEPGTTRLQAWRAKWRRESNPQPCIPFKQWLFLRSCQTLEETPFHLKIIPCSHPLGKQHTLSATR